MAANAVRQDCPLINPIPPPAAHDPRYIGYGSNGEEDPCRHLRRQNTGCLNDALILEPVDENPSGPFVAEPSQDAVAIN